MRGRRPVTLWLGLGLALAVAGCSLPKPPAASQTGQSATIRPAQRPAASSAQLQSYYAQVQEQLLDQGLLRSDAGGPDAPFDDQRLASTFLQIALYNEYTRRGGQTLQLQSQATLRRWEAPIRIALRFGSSVPPAQKARDRDMIASYVQRLSGLTGLPMTLETTNPNVLIAIVAEDERRALEPVLRQSMPALTASDRRTILDLPKSTYCLAVTQSEGDDSIYTSALVVIRAEHPDLLRLSCIHEELAQAMGLPNDSPQARPSIFNDDEEFALLTRQDELMLRMLYNPALRPGMTLEQARPIAVRLAKQLMNGSP